jgi:hypothetical protein
MLAEQLAVLRREPRIALRQRRAIALLQRRLRPLSSLHVGQPRSVRQLSTHSGRRHVARRISLEAIIIINTLPFNILSQRKKIAGSG